MFGWRKRQRNSDPIDGINSINLDGRKRRFCGNADDLYFRKLKVHAKDLEALAALARRVVSKDDVILDIGANIGLTALLLAPYAGKIIAYEPSPVTLALLLRNLALNGVENVEVVPAAASAQAGVLRFHESQFSAASHVVKHGHLREDDIGFTEVPAITLDSQELPRIALIKIDAEGHEPDVLAGARALLARDRPLVFMEFNLWCLTGFADQKPGAFVKMLWDRFEVGHLTAKGDITPLPDPFSFLHDTIVHRRGIDDIVLQPRAGAKMPTLREFSGLI